MNLSHDGKRVFALKMNRNRLQKERNELQKKLMRNKFKSIAEKAAAKEKFNKKQADLKAALNLEKNAAQKQFKKERAELQKKINNAPTKEEKNKLEANLKNVIGEKNKKIEEIEEFLLRQSSLLNFTLENLTVKNAKLKNANVARAAANRSRNQAIQNKANANTKLAAKNNMIKKREQEFEKAKGEVENLQNKLKQTKLTREERNKLRTNLEAAKANAEEKNQAYKVQKKQIENLAMEVSNRNAELIGARRARAQAEKNLANAKAAANAATGNAKLKANDEIKKAQNELKEAQQSMENLHRTLRVERNRNLAEQKATMNANRNEKLAAKNANLNRRLAEKQEALNAQLKNARNEARKAGGAAKANANAKIKNIKANLEKVKTNALNQQKAAMTVQGAFKRAKNRKKAYNQGKIDGRASTRNNPLYATAAQKAANNGKTQKAANNLRNKINSIKPLPKYVTKPPDPKVSFGVKNPTIPGAGPKVNAEGWEKPKKTRPMSNSNRAAFKQAAINEAQNFKTIISKLQPRSAPTASPIPRASRESRACAAT